MYTLNYKYKSIKLLKEWMYDNNIASQKECLIQFFSGIPNEKTMQELATTLSTIAPNAHVIGTTTDGEILGDNVSENEIVISASIFQKSKLVSTLELHNGCSYELGKNLANELNNDDIKVMILFTTGLNVNGETFLEGVKTFSDGKFIVSGGMAGDNAKFKNTFVSHNSQVLVDGAVGVSISSKELQVKNGYRFGWDSVGLPMKVTKSEKNRVYELDNIPIIDIYKKYFGNEIAKLLPGVGIEIPLIVERKGRKIARASINKFDDGSLLFAGNILKNELVRFGVGHADKIINDSEHLCSEYKNNTHPESIFVYSCMARRRLLNLKSHLELKGVASKSSVSGFFTYGEFFSDKKSNYLFNETMTVLAMSEVGVKQECKVKDDLEDENIHISKNNVILNALAHMTNVIAVEWEKKLNHEVKKNKEKERASFQKNKLAQMGEMIGMIAHQWRQPLNAISATGINISLLSGMGMLDDEKLQKSSEFIQEQCQNMSATINTFMNFVKPSKESKNFNLNHTIEAIMQIMGTQLSNHNISIEIISKDTDITLDGYEDLLEQVVINILSNARDAFEELDIEDKFIKITIYTKNNIPHIAIEDNAGGISEEIKDKIFNPYFTTKEQGKGTGIGLFMSMDIMKKSFNGNLKYTSTDNGSIFNIICKEENLKNEV